jgi:hypothetical protein
MKKILFTAVSMFFLIVALASGAEEESGYRCGNLLIEKGVDSFQVLQFCGKPTSKEVIGRTDAGESGGNDLVLEKWIYGPENGYYYILYMKAGVVDKVESEKEGM